MLKHSDNSLGRKGELYHREMGRFSWAKASRKKERETVRRGGGGERESDIEKEKEKA